jgi:hypothetical protein
MAKAPKKPEPKKESSKPKPIIISPIELDIDQLAQLIHGDSIVITGSNSVSDVTIKLSELDQTQDIEDATQQLSDAWDRLGFSPDLDGEEEEEEKEEDLDEDDLDNEEE